MKIEAINTRTGSALPGPTGESTHRVSTKGGYVFAVDAYGVTVRRAGESRGHLVPWASVATLEVEVDAHVRTSAGDFRRLLETAPTPKIDAWIDGQMGNALASVDAEGPNRVVDVQRAEVAGVVVTRADGTVEHVVDGDVVRFAGPSVEGPPEAFGLPPAPEREEPAEAVEVTAVDREAKTITVAPVQGRKKRRRR